MIYTMNGPGEGIKAPLKGGVKTGSHSERRRGGRVRCAEVTSQFGAVFDLSGTGLCVRSRIRPPCELGEVLRIRMVCCDMVLEVPCALTRTKLCNDGMIELGFKYWNLSPEQRGKLREFSQLAADSMVLKIAR